MDMEINEINLSFTEKLIPLVNPKKLIIHHTHNPELTTLTTHKLHQNKNNWAGIGYNYFIELDGSVYIGRGEFVGAHAYGYNQSSIGIALAGNFDISIPNGRQMESLFKLCEVLMKKYDIEASNVIGHNELPKVKKTCPGKNFNMNNLRESLIEIYMEDS